jgi:hypothetical protein
MSVGHAIYKGIKIKEGQVSETCMIATARQGAVTRSFDTEQLYKQLSGIGNLARNGKCRPGYIQTLPRISVVTKNNTPSPPFPLGGHVTTVTRDTTSNQINRNLVHLRL